MSYFTGLSKSRVNCGVSRAGQEIALSALCQPRCYFDSNSNFISNLCFDAPILTDDVAKDSIRSDPIRSRGLPIRFRGQIGNLNGPRIESELSGFRKILTMMALCNVTTNEFLH